MAKPKIALLAGGAFVIFLAAQAIRPSIPHPPVTSEIQAPPEVKQILERRCYACHSNNVRMAWFDSIVPGYWLVAHDVKEAREHLNFSTIGALPQAQQQGALFEAVNQIQLGAMPLPSYRAVHADGTVTAAELATLKAYLAPFKTMKPAAAPAPAASVATAAPGTVQPELNGVPFYPDYKHWRTVSATDRGDNNTLRVITGNDIAIRAIEQHQTHPWPDGTVFAKVAWKAVDDGQGHIHAGQFVQVELMEKDHAKWADSAGWGWGRWLGPSLKPYGKSGKQIDEYCISCHRPVRGNDWVYTLPIDRVHEGGQ